jgi:hypothetical protein
MSMVGDGQEGQPTEGVTTLTQLSGLLDGGEEVSDEGALEESAEGEGEAGESEGDVVETESDEESEAQEESEEEAEEPTFTIKVDGKDVTLKQSELIESAQKGFDYTQKTMAVAEQRKAVDAERAEVGQIRQEVEQARTESLKRLQAYTQFMEAQLGSPPPISLAHDDAASYLAQKELHESRKGMLQQAYAEIQQLEEARNRERQSELAKKAEASEKALRDTLKDWTDKSPDELAAYMAEQGLPTQVLGEALVEQGIWLLAHKAREYDRLQAEKAKLKPKTELPKVHKPKGVQPPQLAQRQEAMKRHKASPSLKTLADLL